VAATTLKRVGWITGAVLSAFLIAALALHGRRSESGLDRFEAAGLMLSISPDRVARVEVTRDGRRWRFERRAVEWVATVGPPPPPGFAKRVEGGLRFLHVTAPQRTLTGEEIGGGMAAGYGLDPPRCTVTVETDGPDVFRIAFGTTNPQGLAQYARVVGHKEVVLLPRFVGEQWDAIAGPR
jgi:hypothetical protein